MVNNIPELQESRKTTQFALVSILVLLGIVSFGLGRLSATQTNPFPVTLCTKELFQENIPAQAISASNTFTQQTNKYVASKNGTVYHLPWCSGAQRILDGNKVWFSTKEEAESAGYRPASNCKGL